MPDNVTAIPTVAAPAAATQAPNLPPGGKTPPPAAPEPKSFKVKVNGQEVTMSEQEVLQHASLGRGAFQKMEEAASLKKNLENFLENFRTNGLEALENPVLGLSEEARREMIDKYYEKKYIKPEQLTPEQKKQQEIEAELEKYREKDRKDKEDADKANHETIKQHFREQYVQQFIPVLEASGLPKTPATMKALAFYVAKAAANGIEAPLEVVAKKVREDYDHAFRELTSSAGPEMLLQFLGPDVAKKIREYDLAQWKAKRGKDSLIPPRKPADDPKPTKKSWAEEDQERKARFRKLTHGK
jgi:hypothetical protein